MEFAVAEKPQEHPFEGNPPATAPAPSNDNPAPAGNAVHGPGGEPEKAAQVFRGQFDSTHSLSLDRADDVVSITSKAGVSHKKGERTHSASANLKASNDGKYTGSLDFGRKRESTENGGADAGGKSITVDNRAQVKISEKGFGGSLTRERSEKTAAGDGKKSYAAGYDAGTYSLSRKSSNTAKDKAGEKNKSDLGTSVSYGEKGLSVAQDYTRTHTNADETTTANKVGVTGNLSQGQFGASFNHTHADKEGETISGFGGSGNIDINKHGDLEGLNLKGSYTHGKTSLSATHDYKVSAKAIQLPGNKWVVSWQATSSNGAGLESAMGEDSGKAGANVSFQMSHTQSGVHPCKTEQEAKDFAENAATVLEPELKHPVRGAEDLLALPVGESRAFDDGKKGSLGATASADGLSVGAGFDAGKTERVQMRKLTATVVELTLTKGTSHGVKGSVSAPGVGLGLSSKSADSDSQVVHIDLSTPEGKQAYQAFTEHHQVIKGATLVSDSKEETRSRGTEVSMLGATITSEGSTSHKVSHQDGHTLKEDSGTRSDGVSVPLVGEFNRSSSLESSEIDGKQRVHTLRETVKSSSGVDTKTQLSQYAGVQDMGAGDEKSSGQWTVSSSVKDADMIDFAAKLIEHPGCMIMLRQARGDGESLRESLINAKSANDMVKAMDDFIAATGHTGVEFFEQQTGVKPELDLELKDEKGKLDKNFQGAAWREGLEGKVDLYAEGVANDAADKRQLVGDIVADIQALMERRAAIADPEQYTDLPRALRLSEIRRTDAFLARLQAMQQQAIAQIRGSSGLRDPASNMTAIDPAHAKQADDALEIAAMESEVCNARSSFQASYQAALHSRNVHAGAGAIAGAGRQTYGTSTWLYDQAEVKSYGSADASYDTGHHSMQGAQALERSLVGLRTQYLIAENPQTQAVLGDQVKQVLSQLASYYSFSATSMATAETGYQGIRARHSDRQGAWGGYQKEAQPLM